MPLNGANCIMHHCFFIGQFSKLSICSGLAAILNAKLLPGSITYTYEELPYRILTLIIAFDIAASL